MSANRGNLNKKPDGLAILDGLAHPVLAISKDNSILYANTACEIFFKSSVPFMCRQKIEYFLPFGSPILALISQIHKQQSRISEYKIDISSPRLGKDKIVDVFGALSDGKDGSIILQFNPQSAADMLDRQLTHRNAARSVTGLASMLAHEIKNPLSGIRGAAQLLEMSGSQEDRTLTQLIKDETDRIVKLVDRMEVFSDERPLELSSVNIHGVLDHVKMLAKSGFGADVNFLELYDPSLPPVLGNRDQLIQIFLNLVKNAVEATSANSFREVTLATGFRPGIRLSVPGAKDRISLPIELMVKDNGAGINEEIKAQIFDPFVTTKTNGSGLGLALVAKIVGDHGGIVQCNSDTQGTAFKILLPMFKPDRKSKTKSQVRRETDQ